jgi:hypothetical protein
MLHCRVGLLCKLHCHFVIAQQVAMTVAPLLMTMALVVITQMVFLIPAVLMFIVLILIFLLIVMVLILRLMIVVMILVVIIGYLQTSLQLVLATPWLQVVSPGMFGPPFLLFLGALK